MKKNRKSKSLIKKLFLGLLSKFFPDLRYKNNAVSIRLSHSSEKPTAILIGFSDWKTWMEDVLADYNVVFMGHSPRVSDSLLSTIGRFKNPHVFAWSYKFPPYLREVCQKNSIPLTFVEDGFLRSIGLGINRSRPMSLVFDKQAMHFDKDNVSELDILLNDYDFSSNAEVLEAAEAFEIAFAKGASKYISALNGGSFSEAYNLKEGQDVIVVLGQVEDDLSIQFGAENFFSGNDLVKKAAVEHPEARVLYRPHPEAVARAKTHYSKPEDVADICDIVNGSWSLKETLEHATRAYTVTSFAGFEALLMGKEVELFGLPFYGGWGLTNDRHTIDLTEKRKRPLSLQEVLAGALVLYPRYFDPITSDPIKPKQAAELATDMLKRITQEKQRLAKL